MGKDSLLNNFAPDHPFVTGDTEGLNRILGGNDYSYNTYPYDEDEEDNSHTYDGWISVGRQVKAGEKSHKLNGKHLFYYFQTKPVESKYVEDEEWEEDDELTYDEWQEHGYQVKRGEKSHRRKGKLLFYFSQVIKI